MKRIYDFSRKPAKRNYTISDLQNLKITGQKLSMANPLNAGEIRACRDAGIDLFVCCLLYTSPSPRDKRQSRMPSSA